MKLHLDTVEVKDVLKDMISEFKDVIKLVVPQIADANVLAILQSIKDPMCLALRPITEHTECLLEEMMPEKDIPHGDTIAKMVGEIQPLKYDQKDMLIEPFDDLKAAHERMACMSGRLLSLSKVLMQPQLMINLKATIRPMIQLNMTAKFLDTPAGPKLKTDLPNDISERVTLTNIADPEAPELRCKHANSMTWLLAVTLTYILLRNFSGGRTQREICNRYLVHLKQLTACITGKKYLGSSEKRALERKHKTSGDNDGSSSSKKPSME